MSTKTTQRTKKPQRKVYAEIPFEYFVVTIGIIGTTFEFSPVYRLEPMLPSWDIFECIVDTLVEAGVFDEDRVADFSSLEEAIDKLKKYLEANPDKRKWPVKVRTKKSGK